MPISQNGLLRANCEQRLAGQQARAIGPDERLQPLFIGYRNLVRGYDLSSLTRTCSSSVQNECAPLDRLMGTQTLVANLELRFPVMGLRSRTQTYGSVPVEGVLFGDTGFAGGGPLAGTGRRLARSVGAAVRVAPFGFVAEEFGARHGDPGGSGPFSGPTMSFDIRSGFPKNGEHCG